MKFSPIEIEFAERIKKLEEEVAALKMLIKVPSQYSQSGCSVCGSGSDGKATGYVCYSNDCPTRITCT